MLDFKLYLSIKFNREIDKRDDYISPGGFEFIVDNKSLKFDFEDSYSNIDNNDKTILHCEMENLDYSSFTDLENLELYDITKLNSIEEAYIYIDTEKGCSKELYPLSIISMKLEFSNGNQFNIPKNILNSYNEKMENENE